MQTGAADALTTIASGAGQLVPDLVGLTALAGLKVIIFYLTLMALFQHGHRLAEWLVRITPLEQAVTRQLGAVFSEFARNVVLAGIAAAVVQGIVAGIGYALAGVERVLLFALLTGVMAFVPVVGTAVAWIPVCLLLLFNHRPGAALFVAVWSLVLTGTIDNIVKPLVVRGKSDLPTLLVFLGVFGGLIAFGLIGLLVGPVLVAMLLALLHIYEEGLAAPTPEPEP
jgi:predicted PurR-regulated permease PerM